MSVADASIDKKGHSSRDSFNYLYKYTKTLYYTIILQNAIDKP